MKKLLTLFIALLLSSCAIHENAKIIYVIRSKTCGQTETTIYQTDSGKRYVHCGWMGNVGDEFQVTKDNFIELNEDEQIGGGV